MPGHVFYKMLSFINQIPSIYTSSISCFTMIKMMRLFATAPTLLLISGALASPFSLEGRSSTPTCVQNASNGTIYQATAGQYEISCGVDYAGGDMGMAWTTSFGACIQTCDSTAGYVVSLLS